jgi:hypothetical protein
MLGVYIIGWPKATARPTYSVHLSHDSLTVPKNIYRNTFIEMNSSTKRFTRAVAVEMSIIVICVRYLVLASPWVANLASVPPLP